MAGALFLCLLLPAGCKIRTPEQYNASSEIVGETISVTLEIRCDTALQYTGDLEEAVAEILPEDGVLLEKQSFDMEQQATVYDLLLRAAKESGLVVDVQGSGSSAYIRGIGGLGEFACGDLSGWTFSVNGEFPGKGCGSVLLREEDEVAFLYSCDLGKDLK